MSEYAHRITGTDIHAGATIASPFSLTMLQELLLVKPL